MKVLLTGAAGLVGNRLASFLTHRNNHVIPLVRKAEPAPGEVRWDPYAKTIDVQALEGLDAVVHLAGENIADGRWTSRKKSRIRESRIQGTRFLSQSLAKLFDPPKVLVSVSAIGYYGNRGEDLLDEESDPGKGFLADVCRDWEAAAYPAVLRGIRVVHPRLGMALSTTGGALARMLPAFRMGFGGKIGNGRQYMSWISMEDLVGIIDYAIHKESLHGPVNAVSPKPVTNQDFSITLARVLSRPSFLALPAFGARIAFGEMADALLLASARVLPARLEKSGYKFQFPELEEALRHELKTPVS